MFPFWDLAVEPILAAAGARRVVEVGALRGETTVRMLDVLGPDSELYVIDPVPVFDPEEHEKQFPGRYNFYRDLSHHVLGELPAMDAALIDGDHNWFTVYHELHLLSDVARKEGKPLPLMVLHDVGWPYGRRDLYYAPEQIPEEFRQPYAQQGMLPGVTELVDDGGLNPTMYNAIKEGGPRNGVMTAVDDFIAEYDRPTRLVVLPVYFGLAIVAELAVIEQHPELGAALDHLESAEGQGSLAELAEAVRLDATILQHRVYFSAEQRTQASARRYLDILKGALLNEHYIEQELRIHQLVRSVENNSDPYGESLRDPTRRLLAETQEIRELRRAGKQGDSDDDPRHYFPLTTMGRVRLDRLEGCLETIRDESVVGDLVECGTGRGGGGVFLRGFLDAHAMPFQRVFVADAFRAAPTGATTNTMGVPGVTAPKGGPGFPELLADLNTVRDAFARFDLLDDRVRFLQGSYPETLPAAPIDKIALLRIGESVTGEVGEVLEALYDRLSLGGFVMIDQYGEPEVRAAVDEFRQRRGVDDLVEQVDWSSALWRKTAAVAPVDDETADQSAATAGPVPLQRPLWLGRCDLTVVVVFYNMKREAARTLHSLSRAYQQGIDDLDYEVIVIDNGSDKDQRLGDEYVKSFGPEFRYIGLGKKAGPSPVAALNRGIVSGRGNAFALMIDGAHLLTPGVLRFGMAGLRTYEPAVVATQQWYVGPGEQGDAIAQGYDTEFENQLFERIEWPVSGYRLFDIGHFIGERDWLDGMWESNCLFVPRPLLDQAGCFDERFSMPGGGFANLEFYERMTQAPDVTLVSILGEGSFHQVHGGTTTNMADTDGRQAVVSSYSDHFEELKGRKFFGYNKPMHFVGTMRPEAARTRARRRVLPNLVAGTPSGTGVPEQSRPMSRDLRAAFVESYWESLAWQSTEWLGQPAPHPPADLFAYQELLSRARPDWIIETGTGDGSRARFLATICDLLDHGQVISIDHRVVDGRPEHPRLTYVTGEAHLATTFDEVQAVVGAEPNALVILGSRTTAGKTFAEFRLYEPLVGPGSYVVIADTVVNGHPVWIDYGPGPYEAVKGVVDTRDDFAADRTMDKFSPSFNPGGFLKRLR